MAPAGAEALGTRGMCRGRRPGRPHGMQTRHAWRIHLPALLLLAACRSGPAIDHLGRRIAPPSPSASEGRGTLVVLLEESATAPRAKVVLRRVGDSTDYLARPTPEEPPRPDRSRRLARYPAGLYQLFATQPGRAPVAAWVRICAGRTDTVRVHLGHRCDLDCQYAPPPDPVVSCGTRRLSSE